jgi:hypothetical protein
MVHDQATILKPGQADIAEHEHGGRDLSFMRHHSGKFSVEGRKGYLAHNQLMDHFRRRLK